MSRATILSIATSPTASTEATKSTDCARRLFSASGEWRCCVPLGYGDVATFHMNEGHSALLTLRLLEEEMAAAGDSGATSPSGCQLEAVRRRCVFTTHTPVPAGHDRFSSELVRRVLGEERAALLDHVLPGGVLNMTDLGAGLSRYVNAVSRRHRSVAQSMLPSCDVRR